VPAPRDQASANHIRSVSAIPTR